MSGGPDSTEARGAKALDFQADCGDCPGAKDTGGLGVSPKVLCRLFR